MEKEKVRVLLVGSGGREHALAWKLSQSPLVDFIKVVPGNGGTAVGLPKVDNIDNVDPNDFEALLQFAKKHEINLVVPGPEVPLVAGITDVFRRAGLRCFGPSKSAARLEGSKTFAKDFMKRHGIPTAKYKNFINYEEARKHLDQVSYDTVIKATGLAAGKGVILPRSKEEAHEALRDIMKKRSFGDAGDEVVIEERLTGSELSFLSFCDGYRIRTLPPGQDHKQIDDGDIGKNTGGMGVYAPSPVASPGLIEEVHRTILQPTIDGLRREKTPFVGMLFTGLMITQDGPRTLEYNVRFGDPETQAMLPLMESDLAEVMVACTEGYLDALNIKIRPIFAATVVVSAGGYPDKYEQGKAVTLNPSPPDTYIFHAGTKMSANVSSEVDGISLKNSLTTSGGRVIAATSTGKTLEAAISQAYEGVSTIRFENMHYRRDIGRKGLEAQRAMERSTNGESLTYASAGVSIESGNSLVKRITPLVASTARPGASAELGGFGGVFDLAGAGYTSAPALIVGCDGVGTKLKIAHTIGKHNTIGIDLVAMCCNDLIVQGATPLGFLDTYSCGKLDPDIAVEVVKGICEGCRQAGCTLLGGETAEMSGLFLKEDYYDLVGSAIGAVAKDRLILPDKESMTSEDVLLGLASNGCHSNGFSLIRKIIDGAGLSYYEKAPWGDGRLVGESLLTPTRIYVKPLLRVVEKNLVKGMAHITGGGLVENVPRMLPKHLAAELDVDTWIVPKALKWMKNQGIDNMEFATVFNTGLGMILAVAKENVDEAKKSLEEDGETVYEIGRLLDREGDGCILKNIDSWEK